MSTGGFLLHGVAHSGNPWLDMVYAVLPFFLIVSGFALVYRYSARHDGDAPPETPTVQRHGDEPV